MTSNTRSDERSRPLHVLTITPFFPRQGNESGGSFVAEPIAELEKAGTRCAVFAVEPFYRPRPEPAGSAPASWYRYPSWPGGLGLSSAGWGLGVRLERPLRELHARTPVDLIHAHGALPCGHAAEWLGRKLRIPFVVTVHGLDAFSNRQVPGAAGEKCAQVSRRVYEASRAVIGVSQHVCSEVESGTNGTANVKVVYNGVDIERFVPGSDATAPLLLSVGNLIPTKGHELVVQALAALRPEFPALIWEVIGDGPELERVRQTAERMGVLNAVRFRGRQTREQVAEACRRCMVFVLPSSYEGLGCVYLEAMASGKVAVGCRGQGIEEIIVHGENGWLISPGSREELIDGVRALLGDRERRSRIGVAAHTTILQTLTLEQQALALMAVYRESVA